MPVHLYDLYIYIYAYCIIVKGCFVAYSKGHHVELHLPLAQRFAPGCRTLPCHGTQRRVLARPPAAATCGQTDSEWSAGLPGLPSCSKPASIAV